MQKFLKKFSSVPNGFIDDFFYISKETYDDNEFSIDINIVIKWLDVRKDNLKRLLVNNFTQDLDYIIDTIKKININSRGASYVENIWLTPDCFKELCMLSQSFNAKEVRKYYLSIEKLLRQYNHYIQERMYKKINLLTTNQKPKLDIHGGLIYFFEALNNIKIDELEEDILKLGKTGGVKNRFKTYNSQNANDIEPLFILEVDNIDAVESCIKNLLPEYQYRKNKEIYQISVEALKAVFVNCNSLVNGFKNYMNKTNPKTADNNFKKLRHSENGVLLYFKNN